MFFGKKKEAKCEFCNARVSDKFNFCPHCGETLMDAIEEEREFGMLGKNDSLRKNSRIESSSMGLEGMGITDKMISSIMNSMMKNLGRQFKDMQDSQGEFNGTEVENIPNGIKIKIGVPNVKNPVQQKQAIKKKDITDEQLKKMTNLPRAPAKTNIRRLSDKVIYELTTPGIQSAEDVFISKLESGYEIKAIGSKKVYVNTLPISLPFKGFSFENNKLSLEFSTEK